MTGAEVDGIKEADDARIWEDINECETVQEAIDELHKAMTALADATVYLTRAARAVQYTPESYRILSLVTAADDLTVDVMKQTERM